MTVLYSSIHAWAPAFCPSCEKLVHYQASDVMRTIVSGGEDIAVKICSVPCKCGWSIEIARVP